jgi:hypothetical protein
MEQMTELLRVMRDLRDADQEERKEIMATLDVHRAKMKADQEAMMVRIEVNQASADANLQEIKEQMLARLGVKIEDNNEVLQGTLLSQMATHKEKMDASIADMKDG